MCFCLSLFKFISSIALISHSILSLYSVLQYVYLSLTIHVVIFINTGERVAIARQDYCIKDQRVRRFLSTGRLLAFLECFFCHVFFVWCFSCHVYYGLIRLLRMDALWMDDVMDDVMDYSCSNNSNCCNQRVLLNQRDFLASQRLVTRIIRGSCKNIRITHVDCVWFSHATCCILFIADENSTTRLAEETVHQLQRRRRIGLWWCRQVMIFNSSVSKNMCGKKSKPGVGDVLPAKTV